MDYLIWQIWLCLFVAFLLGAILGWFFRGSCKKKVAKITADWEQRFGFVEEEKDLFALKVQDRDRLSHDNKSLLSRLTAMENGANLASNVLRENKGKLDKAEDDLSALEGLLEQRDLEIIALKNNSVGALEGKEGALSVDLPSESVEENNTKRLEKEIQMEKSLDDLEALTAEYEKKTSTYKVKLDDLNHELQSSRELKQSDAEEIKTMQALLEAHEKGSHDLLKKENQLQKALSSTEERNLEYEEKASKYNAKIEKLVLDLESSKEKEQESMDEINMMHALLEAHEKDSRDLPKEEDQRVEMVDDLSNVETKPKKDQVPDEKQKNEKVLVSAESYNIEKIDGIGKGFGKRLRAIEIHTTTDLLEKCLNKGCKKHIAKVMKQNKKTIESWCCMADLLRVKGIDGKYAELLYLSGLHSVKELAFSDVSKIENKMKNILDNQQHVKLSPTKEMVFEWISLARLLNSHS